MPAKGIDNLICLKCKKMKKNHNDEDHEFCRNLKDKVKCKNCCKLLQLYYITSKRHIDYCGKVRNKKTLFSIVPKKKNIISPWERNDFDYFSISLV